MTDDDSGVIIGIDLGTTMSLAAVLVDGRPRLLPNAVGERLTPSAVSVASDGAILVGAAARARVTTHPDRTATAFKRDMGTDRSVRIGGRTFTPPQLSALVLRQLKEDTEAALGRTVSEAVVTVPAYFGDHQRQATRDAGAIAGLRVERIINEPTAAALAYGLHERDKELQAVVLDLGGGTFDVTVLEIIEGVIEIQASAGDARLGGEDFADVMAERVGALITETYGDAVTRDGNAAARVREACEDAKRRLTDSEETRIVLPGLRLADGRRVDVDLPVTRQQCDDWWSGLLNRLRAPIERALRDAGVTPDAVDEVLLVGGATRMPCFVALAARLFGRMPERRLPPDEAVAIGAAVQAALKAGDAAVDDMIVTDVAPFSLGIETMGSMGARGAGLPGMFTPILERGTVIPASRVQTFGTVFDGQTQVEIRVYQGEHSLVKDNHLLGTYMVSQIPPAAAGTQGVEVRFTYDLNGLLEVETRVLSTDKKDSFVLERTPGRLSPEAIAAAREAMERLKLHPRDALPNTVALERAEALYVELRGDARAHLAEAMFQFRAALERQEPEQIEPARAALIHLVDALKPR